MEKQQNYLAWERPAFLIAITMIGGYMNAYTYMTRDGILANMHTANMSHLGISLALGDWAGALLYFLPVLACISGAVFSQWLKKLVSTAGKKGDWRKKALVLEAAMLFAVGFVPAGTANIAVTVFISFVMGFQLCLFRTCMGVAHNTTICTGNIRNVGQKLYGFLTTRDSRSFKTFFIFFILTFSFMIGAVPGTLISIWLSERAVWVCSTALLLQAMWMGSWEKRKSSVQNLNF